MTPQDIACEILKAIKEKAEFTLGEEITQAVITTPAYFTSEQRKATKMQPGKLDLMYLG